LGRKHLTCLPGWGGRPRISSNSRESVVKVGVAPRQGQNEGKRGVRQDKGGGVGDSAIGLRGNNDWIGFNGRYAKNHVVEDDVRVDGGDVGGD